MIDHKTEPVIWRGEEVAGLPAHLLPARSAGHPTCTSNSEQK